MSVPGAEKKIIAGLCGIFLGSLGVHKFVMGYTTEGVIMLLVTLFGGALTCGASSGVMTVVGLIEGIIYLTKSDEEFVQTYLQDRKGWL